jgi:hypothetical protein
MKTLYFFATGDCFDGTKITGPFDKKHKVRDFQEKIYNPAQVRCLNYSLITVQLEEDIDETKQMYAFVVGDPFTGMEIKTVNNDLTYLVEDYIKTLGSSFCDSWFVVNINNPNFVKEEIKEEENES